MQKSRSINVALPIAASLALAASVLAFAGCERRLGVTPPQRVNTTNVAVLRKALGGAPTEATGPATAAAEPTGWATIRGTFKLNGTAPPRSPLTVDKDLAVCAPGGKQVLSEELVVDPATSGIRDIVIFLADKAYLDGDPKWEHPDYAATRTATLDFDQKNCVFLSHMFVMRASQTLKILNSDPVGHNTNIAGGGKANSTNVTIPANAYAPYQPGGESPEPFGVACSIHPWMSSRMLVRTSPYNAVTAADGTFEIANVPAGVPLEFRVWQEKSRYLQDVTLNGEATKWPKGRMKVTLEPDQELMLDVVVDASVFAK
jgi:hypothetical protein